MNLKDLQHHKKDWLMGGLSILVLAGASFAYADLHRNYKNSLVKISEQEESLRVANEGIANLQTQNKDLEDKLEEAENKNTSLEKKNKKLDNKNEELDKLAHMDKELLEKYSKVYFLNEHYVPPRLHDIDKEYLSNPDKPQQIHYEVWDDLEDLLKDAKDDGINLQILSAYRSFGTQADLKSTYKVTYGSGANTFSADQGYSEHQLGTTVDFTTPSMGSSLTTAFSGTESYAWLLDHAYRYGFILSYPKGNSYYQYEPWHWRFVGKDLARNLHKTGKNFYDLDQRDINDYLLEMFD